VAQPLQHHYDFKITHSLWRRPFLNVPIAGSFNLDPQRIGVVWVERMLVSFRQSAILELTCTIALVALASDAVFAGAGLGVRAGKEPGS
jgi:hypothetical protein